MENYRSAPRQSVSQSVSNINDTAKKKHTQSRERESKKKKKQREKEERIINGAGCKIARGSLGSVSIYSVRRE